VRYSGGGQRELHGRPPPADGDPRQEARRLQAQPAQVGLVAEGALAAGREDRARPAHPDARHAQERRAVGPVQLDRVVLGVAARPGQLRVDARR
jgi:hypothetical protein